MKLTFVESYEGMVEDLAEEDTDLAFQDASFPQGTVLDVECGSVTGVGDNRLWTFIDKANIRRLCSVPSHVFQLADIPFDAEVMRLLCETDKVIDMVFRRRNCPGSPEVPDLRVIFTVYVLQSWSRGLPERRRELDYVEALARVRYPEHVGT